MNQSKGEPWGGVIAGMVREPLSFSKYQYETLSTVDG